MPAETWDSIADWYADRLRTGSAMHDFARDILMARLPKDCTGLRAVDIGCGEGIITRALADRGTEVVGVDPAARLIEHARAAEVERPAGATYAVDDGESLATVADGVMDWATAGLSLNNVPDLAAAIGSARRVLVPGGRLVFTIPHPCFEAPHATWVEDPAGGAKRVVGEYLTEGFWRSTNPTGVRRAGNQHRNLSTYLMALRDNGFGLEHVEEPAPDERILAEQPQRVGLPPFLLVQACRT